MKRSPLARDSEARNASREMAVAQREELLPTSTVPKSETVPAGCLADTHVHWSVHAVLRHSGRRHNDGSMLVCRVLRLAFYRQADREHAS